MNGYWNSSFIGNIIGSKHAKEKYWSTGFASAAKNFFKDYSQINSSNYIDGSSQWGGDMSGQDRYNAGYKYAMNNLNSLTSDLAENESFNIVTHSEGSAFGAGVAQALLENGYSVSTVVHLSSDEGDEFTTPQSPYTIQLSYEGDWITNNHKIKNVDIFGIVNKGGNSWNTVHGKTKSSDVFKTITDLLNVKLEENIGMKDGKFHHWYKQVEGTAPNGTKFYRIDNKNVE